MKAFADKCFMIATICLRKILFLVKNQAVGTQQHNLKAKTSDCRCLVLSDPTFDKLRTFTWKLSNYQYMLLKLPLEEGFSSAANTAQS